MPCAHTYTHTHTFTYKDTIISYSTTQMWNEKSDEHHDYIVQHVEQKARESVMRNYYTNVTATRMRNVYHTGQVVPSDNKDDLAGDKTNWFSELFGTSSQ